MNKYFHNLWRNRRLSLIPRPWPISRRRCFDRRRSCWSAPVPGAHRGLGTLRSDVVGRLAKETAAPEFGRRYAAAKRLRDRGVHQFPVDLAGACELDLSGYVEPGRRPIAARSGTTVDILRRPRSPLNGWRSDVRMVFQPVACPATIKSAPPRRALCSRRSMTRMGSQVSAARALVLKVLARCRRCMSVGKRRVRSVSRSYRPEKRTDDIFRSEGVCIGQDSSRIG